MLRHRWLEKEKLTLNYLIFPKFLNFVLDVNQIEERESRLIKEFQNLDFLLLNLKENKIFIQDIFPAIEIVKLIKSLDLKYEEKLIFYKYMRFSNPIEKMPCFLGMETEEKVQQPKNDNIVYYKLEDYRDLFCSDLHDFLLKFHPNNFKNMNLIIDSLLSKKINKSLSGLEPIQNEPIKLDNKSLSQRILNRVDFICKITSFFIGKI